MHMHELHASLYLYIYNSRSWEKVGSYNKGGGDTYNLKKRYITLFGNAITPFKRKKL